MNLNPNLPGNPHYPPGTDISELERGSYEPENEPEARDYEDDELEDREARARFDRDN